MLYTWFCEDCNAENQIEHSPVTYLEAEAACTACGKLQGISGYTDGDEDFEDGEVGV